MPGLDGTGPAGMGPMTGGARGWCNPYTYGPYRPPYPAPVQPYPPTYGLGRPRWGLGRGFWGRGFRGGRGWGRGRGRGWW
ncbi:MAG: DUF5320 domain-containing protein [Anaerolineae bacterium]|nr:DUF5320 domain-containing protein [Anaerolineae bacterium]